MAAPKPKRLYKVWRGGNNFLCWGRLIFGPEVASVFLTIFLIAGPSITFCYQVVMKIHKHKIRHEEDLGRRQIIGFPVLLVAFILMISDLIFLMLTSSRDPGIVPRNAHPPCAEEAGYETTPSMEWLSGRTPHVPRTKDVIVNGFTVRVKFCDTCLSYRLPRASHCAICNNCVQKFDHHCPWVGQCIGLRNYRFFFLFISTSTFLCIYVFTFSWINILLEKHNHSSIWKCMRIEVLSVVLLVYTFIAVWFVGGLTIFHSYLICRNQTTYENFRYRYERKENPYNKGLWGNIKDVFFTKIPPSLNDFRSWVHEDTVSFSQEVGMVIGNSRKFDIEMGGKLTSASILPIPSILQNMDYSSTDDNVSEKDRQKDDLMNPVGTPVIQDITTQEPLDCNRRCSADEQIVDEGADQTTAQNADSSSTDDNLSDTDRRDMHNPFAVNIIQESIAREPRDCNQRYTADGQVLNVGADQTLLNESTGQYFYFVDETTVQFSCPSGISESVDQELKGNKSEVRR